MRVVRTCPAQCPPVGSGRDGLANPAAATYRHSKRHRHLHQIYRRTGFNLQVRRGARRTFIAGREGVSGFLSSRSCRRTAERNGLNTGPKLRPIRELSSRCPGNQWPRRQPALYWSSRPYPYAHKPVFLPACAGASGDARPPAIAGRVEPRFGG
jgi:hypothetical protein